MSNSDGSHSDTEGEFSYKDLMKLRGRSYAIGQLQTRGLTKAERKSLRKELEKIAMILQLPAFKKMLENAITLPVTGGYVTDSTIVLPVVGTVDVTLSVNTEGELCTCVNGINRVITIGCFADNNGDFYRIIDGKVYCGDLEMEVTDNDGICIGYGVVYERVNGELVVIASA